LIGEISSLESQATALLSLRQMYEKDDARFKSKEQAEAIQVVLKRKEDVLVILPTGGGKTLIFQLAAFLEKDMTTVVILPFVALLEEMLERCRDVFPQNV